MVNNSGSADVILGQQIDYEVCLSFATRDKWVKKTAKHSLLEAENSLIYNRDGKRQFFKSRGLFQMTSCESSQRGSESTLSHTALKPANRP